MGGNSSARIYFCSVGLIIYTHRSLFVNICSYIDNCVSRCYWNEPKLVLSFRLLFAMLCSVLFCSVLFRTLPLYSALFCSIDNYDYSAGQICDAGLPILGADRTRNDDKYVYNSCQAPNDG